MLLNNLILNQSLSYPSWKRKYTLNAVKTLETSSSVFNKFWKRTVVKKHKLLSLNENIEAMLTNFSLLLRDYQICFQNIGSLYLQEKSNLGSRLVFYPKITLFNFYLIYWLVAWSDVLMFISVPSVDLLERFSFKEIKVHVIACSFEVFSG